MLQVITGAGFLHAFCSGSKRIITYISEQYCHFCIISRALMEHATELSLH